MEIEAKFQGDASVHEALLHHLGDTAGFSIRSLGQFRRTHLYYRSGPELEQQAAQPRLRLILKNEGGGRYDYKSLVGDNAVSRSSTDVSLSWAEGEPVTLAVAVALLSEQVGAADQAALRHFLEAPEFSVALQGIHHKTLAISEHLEVEVSWDDMVLLNTGDRLCELEIELKKGDKVPFDALIEGICAALSLKPTFSSKYQQALPLIGKSANGKDPDG